MERLLKLKNKNGETINVNLKELDLSYIDKIVELQDSVYDGLEDKQLYAPSQKEEFEECINVKGKIVGCTTEKDELIAIGVYIKNGYDSNNYGYDLGLQGEELLKVGQIESTLVKAEYRGNRLQRTICEALEKIAKKEGVTIMTSTASPYNEFSVNTFKLLGYEVKKNKIKYGGLRRYVLAKELI